MLSFLPSRLCAPFSSLPFSGHFATRHSPLGRKKAKRRAVLILALVSLLLGYCGPTPDLAMTEVSSTRLYLGNLPRNGMAPTPSPNPSRPGTCLRIPMRISRARPLEAPSVAHFPCAHAMELPWDSTILLATVATGHASLVL